MGISTKWRIEVRTKNSLPPNIFGTLYFTSNSNPANMATVPVLLTVVLTTVRLFHLYLDHSNHEVLFLCRLSPQPYFLFSSSWWQWIHHWFYPSIPHGFLLFPRWPRWRPTSCIYPCCRDGPYLRLQWQKWQRNCKCWQWLWTLSVLCGVLSHGGIWGRAKAVRHKQERRSSSSKEVRHDCSYAHLISSNCCQRIF